MACEAVHRFRANRQPVIFQYQAGQCGSLNLPLRLLLKVNSIPYSPAILAMITSRYIAVFTLSPNQLRAAEGKINRFR